MWATWIHAFWSRYVLKIFISNKDKLTIKESNPITSNEFDDQTYDVAKADANIADTSNQNQSLAGISFGNETRKCD